jgi:hypothetical protein
VAQQRLTACTVKFNILWSDKISWHTRDNSFWYGTRKGVCLVLYERPRILESLQLVVRMNRVFEQTTCRWLYSVPVSSVAKDAFETVFRIRNQQACIWGSNIFGRLRRILIPTRWSDLFWSLNTSCMKQPSWCSISRLPLSQTERRKYKATVDPASEDNPSAVLSMSYTFSSCFYTGYSGHLYSQLDSWVSRQYFVLSLVECWYKSEKLSHYFSFLTPTGSGRVYYAILFTFKITRS